MTYELKSELYNKLRSDKIKINWNKNPIKMDLFLSFLTIQTEILRDHLGSYTGWTRRINKDYNLTIVGGGVNGIEYLDHLEFRHKLSNQYNNYVNPFFMFEVFTDEGKRFFIDYYKPEIDSLLNQKNVKIIQIEEELNNQTLLLDQMIKEVENLRKI